MRFCKRFLLENFTNLPFSFRFFGGEDNTLNDQQSNHQQQQPDGISGLLGLLTGNAQQGGGNPQSQLNLLALQNIAAALGGTGATSAVRDPPAQSNGGLNLGALSGLASNFQLLSTLGSLFGGRGRTNSQEAEIQGRQVDAKDGDENFSQFKDLDFNKVIKNMIVAYSGNSTDDSDTSGRTKRDIIPDTSPGTTTSPPVSSTIQARIINKAPIYSYIPDTTGQSLTSNNRYTVNGNNPSYQQHLPEPPLNSIDIDRYPLVNNQNRITPDQIPIKTGTGSLAFSNEHFNNRYTRPNNANYQQQQLLLQQQLQEEMENEQKDRLAEQDRLSQLSQYYTNTHRFQYNSGSRPASSYQGSQSNYNRYSYDRYRPSGSSGSSNNNYNNRYTSHTSSSNYNTGGGGGAGRVYVTNAQGVNEYYLENGRKHYL